MLIYMLKDTTGKARTLTGIELNISTFFFVHIQRDKKCLPKIFLFI